MFLFRINSRLKYYYVPGSGLDIFTHTQWDWVGSRHDLQNNFSLISATVAIWFLCFDTTRKTAFWGVGQEWLWVDALLKEGPLWASAYSLLWIPGEDSNCLELILISGVKKWNNIFFFKGSELWLVLQLKFIQCISHRQWWGDGVQAVPECWHNDVTQVTYLWAHFPYL